MRRRRGNDLANQGQVLLSNSMIDIHPDNAVTSQGQITALPNSRLTGANFAQCLGASGDYFSTPDSAAVSVTGDIDIRAKVSMADWTPATESTIVCKWESTGNEYSFAFVVTTGGNLRLYLSDDGSSNANVLSSVATGFSDGSTHWVRATWSDSGDVANFYTSEDGQDWTLLGDADRALASSGIYDGTALVEVGALDTGTDLRLNGRVYRAQVLNAIDGTVVADFNPNDYREGSTFISSDTGETWTIQGNNYIVEPRAPTGTNTDSSGVLQVYGDLPGASGDYFSTPDSVANSITGDIDIRFQCAIDDLTAFNTVVAKLLDSTSNYSFMVRMSNTGTITLFTSPDGTGASATSGASTESVPFANDQIWWGRATLDVDDGAGNRVYTFYTSNDGETWTQLGSVVSAAGTTSIADTASGIEVGTNTGGTGNVMAGKTYRVIIKNGIDGETVVDFNPLDNVSGSTFNSGTTGETWTANGNAAIHDFNLNTLVGTAANLRIHHSGAMRSFGATADSASQPDAAALTITGDIDLRCHVACDDWFLASAQHFISKWNTTRAYMFRLDSSGNGYPQVLVRTGGGNVSFTADAAVPAVNGQPLWVRATLDADNGASGADCTFYTSVDGETWTQLGTVQTNGATVTILDDEGPINIGNQTTAGSGPLAAEIYRAQVFNGIDGTLVLDFDPTQHTDPDATVFNSNAYLNLPGSSGDYGSTPDSESLDITGDIDIIAKVNASDWTPGDTALVAKWTSSGNQRSYVLRIEGGGNTGKLNLITTPDGSTSVSALSTVVTGFDDGSTHWVRATRDVDDGSGNNVTVFYTSDDDTDDPDSVTWTQLGDSVSNSGTTSIYAGSAVLELGTLNAGTANILDGQILRAQVKNGIGGTLVADFNPANYDGADVHGVKRLDLLGSADYANTPDSVATSITGDLDLRAKLSVTDWTSSDQVILTKFTTGQRSYRLRLEADGKLKLFLSADGTNASNDESTESVSFENGQIGWVRATWDSTSKDVVFYTSTDGQTWTQLGDTASINVSSIYDGTASLSLSDDSGGGDDLTGTIYEAYLYNGIDGDLVAKYIATDQEDGATTVNGVMMGDLPGASGDYFSTPDSAAASVESTIDIRARVNSNDWTPSSAATIVDKFTTNSGYLLQILTDGTLTLLLGDGSSTGSDPSSAATGFDDGSTHWIRAHWDNDNNELKFYTSDDDTNDPDQVTWTQLGDTQTISLASIQDNAEDVEIGARIGGTANRLTGYVYRLAVYDGVNKVLDFNPELWSSGTLTAATGEVWTANGNAAFTGQWTKQGNATFEEVYSLNGNAEIVGRFTLNGDTFIQNTGHKVAHSIGSVGIESAVGRDIDDPGVVFTVARVSDTPSADSYIHGGKGTASKQWSLFTDDSETDRFTIAESSGVGLQQAFDNDPHLFTGQFNGDESSKLTVSGLGEKTGDTGSNVWEYATLFDDRNGSNTMQGYIGRMTVFDRELNEHEIEAIQRVLTP